MLSWRACSMPDCVTCASAALGSAKRPRASAQPKAARKSVSSIGREGEGLLKLCDAPRRVQCGAAARRIASVVIQLVLPLGVLALGAQLFIARPCGSHGLVVRRVGLDRRQRHEPLEIFAL